MRTWTARPATDEVYELAEGPVWDPIRQRVCWVDIEAALVLSGELDGDRVRRTRRLALAEPTVGAAVPCEDGRLLVAGARRLVVVDDMGEEESSTPVLPADRERRLNDGGCDPAGRFLVGSMALDDEEGRELLVRREPGTDPDLTVLDDDLTLSNGLAWSPDHHRFYSIDSEPGSVWGRDYDPESGTCGERELLFTVDDGTPDGMCADVDGNLWIAVFGAGEVRCFTPAGEHVATVEVGTPHTTSVAFVGRDLDRLLITTGRVELSAEQREKEPDAGKLFLADVETKGTPVALWSGR
jgi:sugar lactone lactonase YvrE